MTKIAPKKYAQALVMVLSTKKNKEEVNEVLQKFSQILVLNRDARKLNSIIIEFQKAWHDKQGSVASQITSARELDLEIIEILKTTIKDFSGKKEVEVKSKIDPSLLGGVIIRYQDRKIDLSLKTRINKLKEKFYN